MWKVIATELVLPKISKYCAIFTRFRVMGKILKIVPAYRVKSFKEL